MTPRSSSLSLARTPLPLGAPVCPNTMLQMRCIVIRAMVQCFITHVVSSRYFESDFDDGSCCHIDGGAYEDVIGHGRKSLTGDEYFLPAELEVYAVNARDTNVMQQL